MVPASWNTGAVGLVIAPVAREYGFYCFIATVIFAGLFQIILGSLGVDELLRFIPRSFMGSPPRLVGDAQCSRGGVEPRGAHGHRSS